LHFTLHYVMCITIYIFFSLNERFYYHSQKIALQVAIDQNHKHARSI
jgi:hypothetical protein